METRRVSEEAARDRNGNPTRYGLLKYCVSLVFLLLCPLSPVCLVRSTKQIEVRCACANVSRAAATQNLDFTEAELAEIDRVAGDANINLWAESSGSDNAPPAAKTVCYRSHPAGCDHCRGRRIFVCADSKKFGFQFFSNKEPISPEFQRNVNANESPTRRKRRQNSI